MPRKVLLSVVRCPLPAVCCPSSVVRCPLTVVRCLLSVARCLLSIIIKVLLRYLPDEPAGTRELHPPIAEARLGVGEDDLTLGPGEGYVKETALLLEFTRHLCAHLAGEKTFLQPCDEDDGELETFGRMDGHHVNLVGIFLGIIAVEVCGKAGHLQVIAKGNTESLLLIVDNKTRDSIEHLLEILLPRDVVRVASIEVMFLQSALLCNADGKGVGIVGLGTLVKGLNHVEEGLELLNCLLWEW